VARGVNRLRPALVFRGKVLSLNKAVAKPCLGVKLKAEALPTTPAKA
jgi:hypothetical protein